MEITEQIAKNFAYIAYSLAPNPKILSAKPDDLKKFHIVWDGETVEEIALGIKTSDHNWDQKLRKIQDFEQKFLTGIVKDSEILVARDIRYSEYLIIDGCHRSIGFYKAFLKDPSIILNTRFKYKLFESDQIIKMSDYHRLFGMDN